MDTTTVRWLNWLRAQANRRYTFAMGRIRLFVACFLLPGALHCVRTTGQLNEDQTAAAASSGELDAGVQRKAESALDRIQKNDVGQGVVDARYSVELAAHVDRTRAIPVLEAYFARSNDPELRGEIASVLVSLGDKDPQFWTLIFNEAKAALGEDPPDPYQTGQDGQSSAPCTSEAFLKWAEKHNLSPEKACGEAGIGIALRVRPLADCGDRRVIPVLRHALTSSNPIIKMMAAHGLTLTGDRDAITLVIEAIEHAKPDEAQQLADAMIESDDPRAACISTGQMSITWRPISFEHKAHNGVALFWRTGKTGVDGCMLSVREVADKRWRLQ